MSDLPAAGWYPDPADPAMVRWWDGTQWTDRRGPAGPGGPPPGGFGGSFGGQPSYQGSYPSYPGYGGDPAQGGAGSYPGAGGDPGYPGYGGPGYPAGPRMRGAGRYGRYGRVRGPNSFSLTAIGFGVAYVVLAFVAHFVLLGIVPLISAMRAVQRREKLAPIAVAVAVLTIASAIFILHRYH